MPLAVALHSDSLSSQSSEDLQQQLMSTSMELQSAREAASLQSKLSEAKISRLQGLLNAARKERDEARSKCGKLRECLLHLSRYPQALALPSAAESSCSLRQASLSTTSSPAQLSYHSPASPSIDGISFQDLKQKICTDDGVFMFEDDASAKSLPHQTQDVQDILLHDAPDVQDIFALELNADPSVVTMDNSQQQFSMDILNDDVGLDEDESLDLSDLQVEQPLKSSWEGSLSSHSSWDAPATNGSSAGRTLLRQTSCVSSVASESWGTAESPKVSAMPCNQKLTMPSTHSLTMQPSHNSLSKASPSNVIIPEFVNNAVYPCVGTMQLKSSNLVEVTECIMNGGHENTLPEKGRLLQAVMQAGPLLQNLLLAGPLPQWRYPPPQLNTLDIPRVPMAPSSMLPHDYLPLSWSAVTNHAPIMQSPLLNPTKSLGNAHSAPCTDHRGVFGASNDLPCISAVKCERNVYAGGRKLRRLSPVGVK